MAEALLDGLAPVITRWTMGGSAAHAAPAGWRGGLGHDAGEAELRLLALTGQLLGTMAVAEPAGDLQVLGDLPRLAKPPLPEALRPRCRRILAALRDADQRRALLALLDRRGWTMHPADWLPGANEHDLPATYAAWQDWVAQAAACADTDEISPENWDRFGPAARRVAFAELRRRDPARASALLAAKIASETPDRRLLFLDLLTGLSATDVPLLETLASDRAPRVKARAMALLARLGKGGAVDEDAREIAGFFSTKTTGWLRKSLRIVPQELKTPAQRNRRGALMEALTLTAMAQALALSPEELIAAWPWGEDTHADHALAAMAERSAADEVVVLVAEALASQPGSDILAFIPLLPRMSATWRQQVALRMLEAKEGNFLRALPLAGGDGEIAGTIRTAAGKALLASLVKEDAKPADHAPELAALGLLSARAAASEALGRLTDAGLIASDPRLDLLRLNAALNDEGSNP
ncbi:MULTISPECIES: DUF5691 domain-containing protein [unclassified Sphingomonas]|uniref:DUF5691 domain-containing protein n=1 Tax=Novosphingobium rhizosphaerae TaxID=1551649 RepID=UPI0015C7ED41